MALGFHFGGAGGGMPSNPVLFENGAYMEGVSEVNINYASGVNFNVTKHSIVDGSIQFTGLNGGWADDLYLTFDLSKYVGKNLYYKYAIEAGAETTKGFQITSSSKKPAFGLACPNNGGWQQTVALGITNEAAPTYITTDSDLYTSQRGSSPTSPVLTVYKIWIAD